MMPDFEQFLPGQLRTEATGRRPTVNGAANLELNPENQDLVLEILRNWQWSADETWFKETIPPGSSFLKDEHLFQ
jgi:hypothetical protein